MGFLLKTFENTDLMCYEAVNQNVFHHLPLNKKSYFFYKTTYLDIFWIAVGGGGYILAVTPMASFWYLYC